VGARQDRDKEVTVQRNREWDSGIGGQWRTVSMRVTTRPHITPRIVRDTPDARRGGSRGVRCCAGVRCVVGVMSRLRSYAVRLCCIDLH